jgi:DNA primase
MSIPKYFVEQVKDAIRLSELIGRYVVLRRNGKEFGGLCPFHSEKSPSFTVSDEKGFYHCFGCQAHGDAVSFMMQHERMNYVEAVKYLAGTVGMDVPEETDEAKRDEERRVRSLNALEAAAVFYQAELRGNSGMQAREYVSGRGLRADIVTSFRLGYAPPRRDELKRYLLDKGFDEHLLLDAGLLVKPETGESYDKFRDRLMFPILHKRGQVVAFGGRLLSNNPESKAPKYLNSPETLVFKKRDMLYHLYEASVAARVTKRILVVEGYMDVIACAQAGVEDAVATLGTAFTPEHLQALWQQVDEPLICLDGDTAGSRAMLRSAEIALPLLVAGKSVRFAIMPKGDDPDSLIRRAGRGAFEEVMRQSIGLHEALLNNACQGIDARDPSQRASLEKKLEGLAGSIQDATVRQHFRNFFRESLWEISKKQSYVGGKKPDAVKGKVQRSIAAPAAAVDRLVRSIFKLLLWQPELLHEAEAEGLLTHMVCHYEPLEHLRECLMMFGHEHIEVAQLPMLLASRGVGELAEQLKSDSGLIIPKIAQEEIDEAKTILKQLVNQYDTLNLESEYALLSERLGEAELQDEDMERLMLLQREIQMRRSN